MKKSIVFCLVIAVAVAIGFALFIHRKLALVDVAELLPADTVMLIHLPDVPRSRERWKETALAQIAREPEVVAFLQRPKSKAPQLQESRARVNRLLATDPREAFLAITSLAGAGNIPKMIAGFSYRGKQEDAEALVAGAKKKLQAAYPTGKSDLVAYQGTNIETFATGNFSVEFVFAKQWCFIADDLDLLKATLDRFNGAHSDDSLRKNKHFASSLVRMAQQPDTLLFVQPRELTERLATLIAASGQPANPGVDEMRKIAAVTATTKMEGANIRDTMFLQKPVTEEHPPMPRHSLAITSADTLLYYAAVMTLSGAHFKMPNPALDTTGVLSQIQALGTALQARGLTWSDAASAFGPELALALDWQPAAPQPALVLSLDVRDVTKAKTILETMISSGLGGTWVPQTVDGTPYFSMNMPGLALVTPTIALSDKFLLLGLSLDSVKTAINRATNGGAEVNKTADFVQAAGTVNTPTTAFGYVAAKSLFERIYGTARPFVVMWSAFAPKVGEYVDVNKLPATETISKHLGPIIFSQSSTNEGMLSESVGPLTFGQAAMVIGGGLGAAAVPMMKARMEAGGMVSPAPVPVQPNAPPPTQGSPAVDDTVVVPGTVVPAPSASPGI